MRKPAPAIGLRLGHRVTDNSPFLYGIVGTDLEIPAGSRVSLRRIRPDGSVAIVRERAREFAAGLARRLGLDVVIDVEDAAGRPVLSVATDSVCHAASAKKGHA